MKKLLFIIMIMIPFGLNAQVASTGSHISGTTGRITSGTVTGLSPAGTQSLSTGIAQSGGKIGLSELLNQYSEDSRFSFFEVNEEMFKAFCELENADSTSIALFKKIKSVKMLEYHRSAEEQEELESADPESVTLDQSFYTEVTEQLDTTGYNQLLKSRNNHTIALFLKKENGPADNEFLLITDRMVIDVRGDIMVKTIYQMEEMMSFVQQILPN